MAYDPYELNKDVRIYLGGVEEDKLPETTVIHWGDFYDAQEDWTSNYPYILWQTTLSCIQYLKAAVATSTTSTKSSSKEKVGEVEVSVSNDYGSSEELMDAYDALYADFLDSPDKFGLKLEKGNIVHVGGVYKDEVDSNRSKRSIASVYDTLPVTAFPKQSRDIYNRSSIRRYRRY